jgi:hypothetical protein
MNNPARDWRDWSDAIFDTIVALRFDSGSYRQALDRWIEEHPATPQEAVLHAQERLAAHYAVSTGRRDCN